MVSSSLSRRIETWYVCSLSRRSLRGREAGEGVRVYVWNELFVSLRTIDALSLTLSSSAWLGLENGCLTMVMRLTSLTGVRNTKVDAPSSSVWRNWADSRYPGAVALRTP